MKKSQIFCNQFDGPLQQSDKEYYYSLCSKKGICKFIQMALDKDFILKSQSKK